VDVLVIGGSRFVGYLLVWRLLAGRHRVTLLNRGTIPDPFGDRVARVTGDRRDPSVVRAIASRRFDAVVDFAAFVPSDVEQVVAAFGGKIAHYVFVSTGQVYLVLDPVPRPAREQDYAGTLRIRPADPDDLPGWEYGMGKRGCEDLLAAAWAEARFPSTRFRIPVVNGERDYHRRIEGYLWRLLDGGPLLLPPGSDRPMRHVYGAAVAAAIARNLGNPACLGRAFNLSQRQDYTLRELVAALADLLGVPAPVPTVEVSADELGAADLRAVDFSPFSDPQMSLLDPGLAEAELGFTHEPPASYLPKIVSSFLAHPPASPPPSYARRAEELALARRAASVTGRSSP
jgi:nucleoside-diphosphate-sugar epimerase